MLRTKVTLVGVFLLFTILGMHAQQTKPIDVQANVKARFIYGFTKYIKWPSGKIKTFKIAVLGKDSAIYSELIKLAKSKEIEGKPIEILAFNNPSEIERVQLLYVHKKNGFKIDMLLRKSQNHESLLVTENYPFKSSMINFVQIDKFQKFELNLARLYESGFKVDERILKEAITSVEDWQKLAREKENRLSKELKKVEEQKKQITELAKIQQEQKQAIIEAEVAIENKQKEIEATEIGLQKLLAEHANQEQILKAKIQLLRQQEDEIQMQEAKIAMQQKQTTNQQLILNNQESKMKKQGEKMKLQLREMKLQEGEIKAQKAVLSEQISLIESQQIIMYLFIGIIVLVTGIGGYVYISNKKLAQKNTAIRAQKEQISKKNEAITSSINYAQKIQKAILTSSDYLDKILPEHFVFYRPRDIVSGDFYWAYNSPNNRVIFAAVDCTGHGVPGAFMSMIGNSLLNETIIENGIEEPDQVLNHLRLGIIKSLKQTGQQDESRDGMDISLCSWNPISYQLDFAGAHNPLYHISKGEITEYKADKQSIGWQPGESTPFKKQTIQLQKEDCIYLFSDGFVDQKGGNKNKKYYYAPFKNFLVSISNEPMTVQKQRIQDEFEQWKGTREQIDDVCIFGVRV